MPKTPVLDTLPHLKAAMVYQTANGSNTCVQRAAALMLDLTGATLVFGLMRPATAEERERIGEKASPVPFIHAWVEYRGELLAPTLIETFGDLRALPVEVYYGANGIKTTWRLEHKAFMQIARRYKLSSAFKHQSARAGDGMVADALLRSAGVKYVLSDRRTILPSPQLSAT